MLHGGRTQLASILVVATLMTTTVRSDALAQSDSPSRQLLAEFQIGADGRPICIDGSVNGAPVRFIVDTNASATSVDAVLESCLGTSIAVTEVDTPGGRLPAKSFAPPQISIGGLSVQSKSAATCIDLSQVRMASGEDFNAILGMDFLSQFVVQIDFDGGRLRLFAPTIPGEKWSGAPSSITFFMGVPSIRARIGDSEYLFRIDTGSNSNCLIDPLFDLMASDGRIKTGPAYAVATLAGPVASHVGLASDLSIGNFTRPETILESAPMSILGLPLISRFNWTFDFPNGVAYLSPNAGFNRPESCGTSGIAAVVVDSKVKVVAIKSDSAAKDLVQFGDEIVGVNGRAVGHANLFELRQALTSTVGSQIELEIVRNGQRFVVAFATRDRLGR